MRDRRYKMGNFSMLAFWIIMAILGSVPMAQGQDLSSSPCVDPAKQYCNNVIPGGGRIMQCLRQHENDLSIACKDWIASEYKKTENLIAVCRKESAQYCSAYGNDMAALAVCLNSNYDGLGMDCKDKIKDIMNRF
jgi:hypothetical protein